MPSKGQWLGSAYGRKGALVNLSLISYWVCSLTLHSGLKELLFAASQNSHPHCAFARATSQLSALIPKVKCPCSHSSSSFPWALTHHSSLVPPRTTGCASKGQDPSSVSSSRSHCAGSSGDERTFDGPCTALKMTTLPITLAPAAGSLRSSRFQFLQYGNACFCLWDFAVSVPFV